MAHDEGFHAGHALVGRRCDEREAADHHAFHDKVHLPPREPDPERAMLEDPRELLARALLPL
ncbi:MAG TPA: hypothetical protein VMK12_25710 [Anaeromyxobacteraceae bacterium]|nr:hypothetical protein [Anaeromyxobacteraceae bacterium]